MNKYLVSVIIVCHHEFDVLDNALAGILETTVTDYSCTIVYNSGRSVKSRFNPPHFQFLSPPTEMSITEARNWGVNQVSSDIIVFLDPDVIIKKDTIEKLLVPIIHGGFDAVIGSYELPSLPTNLPTMFKTSMNHFFHQQGEDNTTFWSACSAIKRKVFLEVGGFSTEYRRPSIEDIELGYRLIEKRKKIRFDSEILVVHAKKWTWFQLIITDTFYRASPWMQLIIKKNIFQSKLNISHNYKLSLCCIWISLALFLSQYRFFGFVFLFSGLALNTNIIMFFYRKYSLIYLLPMIFMLMVYYISAGVGASVGIILACIRGGKKWMPRSLFQ